MHCVDDTKWGACKQPLVSNSDISCYYHNKRSSGLIVDVEEIDEE